MLVLTRKKGQSVIINDNIEIILVDVQGDHVKIGINAPKDVTVHRKEVYEEIQNENKKAALSNVENLKNLTNVIKENKKDS